MSKIEPHPTDEGKFQSTIDGYGHGVGNGKSRSAVYKHLKSIDFVQPPESEEIEETESYTKSEEIEPELNTLDVEDLSDSYTVEDEEQTEWGSIDWASDEGYTEPIPRKIPKPISEMARGKATVVNTAATKTMIRFGYISLDRMIVHWGRGVMNDNEWEIERSPADLDTLEDATVGVLDYYGVTIPMSPVLVWGAAFGAAYVPPVVHIRKNADPTRRKKSLFGFLKGFRRGKKKGQMEVVTDVEDIDA